MNHIPETFDNEGEEQEQLDPIDTQTAEIIQSLYNAQLQIEEEEKDLDRAYIFNQHEFVDSLNYVVEDQLSVLRGDKITMQQWSERFNRWFVFCDAVVNLGISVVPKAEALDKQDYAEVFKGVQVNAVFNTTFLKPRNIRVIFSHKSPEVKEKYKWLAMPCLIVKDEKGVEHEIAITPSPNAAVWWLDLLSSFHATYNWNLNPVSIPDLEEDGEENDD